MASARPRRDRLRDVARVFVKLGAVVYGSGYVLLAFLRADLVERLHWLTSSQLIDAVAVGQVTPGPVFTTATFIGYLLEAFPGRSSPRSASSCRRSSYRRSCTRSCRDCGARRGRRRSCRASPSRGSR